MLNDEQLFQIAHTISLSGTCSRLQVGAIIVKDNRIVSTGYNGTASGLEHCHHFDTKPCHKSVHAESNAIIFAARHGMSTNNADLYCTHMPCGSCAGLIINAGIKTVRYFSAYRNDSGIRSLQAAGVKVRSFHSV